MLSPVRSASSYRLTDPRSRPDILKSRTVGLTTTLDFLKYLGRTHYGSEPQLELTYNAEWTRAQDLDTGSSKDLNQSLVLSTELKF